MNKRESEEQYQKHAQFNLTKLIKRNYEAGTPLPKEYFDGLDFLEESEKVLMLPIDAPYGKQSRHDVKESLAANIVGHLPLEYYKQYIHPTWITSNKLNDYGIITKALEEQKHDFLYEILSQCKEYLKEHSDSKKSQDNKFMNAYENGLLSQVLNMDYNLNHLKNSKANQEAYDNYFKVFKVALSDFDEYYNKKYEQLYGLNMAKTVEFNDELWFIDYNKIDSFFRGHKNQAVVLENIIEDSKAFNFFKDIFNQHQQVKQQLDKNTFEKAFYNSNKKVAGYLVENNFVNSKEVYQTFETVLQYWLNGEKAKKNRRYDNQLGDNSIYLKTLLDIAQKNVPNHKIENYELCSHILPAINNKLFDDVMVKYPELKEEKLKDGLTLNQWYYAKKLFNEFINEHDFKLKETNYDANYLSFDLFFMDRATQYYTPTREINLDEKMAVEEVIAINFLPLIDTKVSNKEMIAIYYNYTLNKQMPENKNEVKKAKI